MNLFKTGALLLILTYLLGWVGYFVAGPNGALTALVLSLIFNGIMFYKSDKIVLSMYRAYEIPKDKYYHLYKMVEELSKNAGIPAPKVYMVENTAPNAFATGRDPKHGCVCVTKGLLQLLEKEELKGVLAHEIAHIKNRDTLIMCVTASVTGAVMMIANMARWAAIFGIGGRSRSRDGGSILGLVALSIVAPIAALIVQFAISRQREYSADSQGAKIAEDNRGLAVALKKISVASIQKSLNMSPQTAHLFIVNPFKGNLLSNIFSTHPPVNERIRRLEMVRL